MIPPHLFPTNSINVKGMSIVYRSTEYDREIALLEKGAQCYLINLSLVNRLKSEMKLYWFNLKLVVMRELTVPIYIRLDFIGKHVTNHVLKREYSRMNRKSRDRKQSERFKVMPRNIKKDMPCIWIEEQKQTFGKVKVQSAKNTADDAYFTNIDYSCVKTKTDASCVGLELCLVNRMDKTDRPIVFCLLLLRKNERLMHNIDIQWNANFISKQIGLKTDLCTDDELFVMTELKNQITEEINFLRQKETKYCTLLIVLVKKSESTGTIEREYKYLRRILIKRIMIKDLGNQEYKKEKVMIEMVNEIGGETEWKTTSQLYTAESETSESENSERYGETSWKSASPNKALQGRTPLSKCSVCGTSGKPVYRIKSIASSNRRVTQRENNDHSFCLRN